MFKIRVKNKNTEIPAYDAHRIGHDEVQRMVQGVMDRIQADRQALWNRLKIDECDHYFIASGDTLVYATVEKGPAELCVDLNVCTVNRHALFFL